MADARPEILLIGPLLPQTMEALDATYRVHRYDLAPDRDALLDDLAPRVRAIATRGDYPLPASVMPVNRMASTASKERFAPSRPAR